MGCHHGVGRQPANRTGDCSSRCLWNLYSTDGRGYLLCNLNLFSGGLCSNTNGSIPLYRSKGLRGLNNALKITLMYKASKNPSFDVEKKTQPAKQEALSTLPELVLLKMLQLFLPHFRARVKGILTFRTTIMISRVQQTTPVFKTGWGNKRQGGLAAERVVLHYPSKQRKDSDTQLWRYLCVGSFLKLCCCHMIKKNKFLKMLCCCGQLNR